MLHKIFISILSDKSSEIRKSYFISHHQSISESDYHFFRRTLPIPGRLPRGGSAVQTKGPTPISKTRISNKKQIVQMNNGSLLMTPMSVRHNHKPIGPIGCVTCCRLLPAWLCLYSSFSLVAGSSLDNPKREIGKMIKMERKDIRSKPERPFFLSQIHERPLEASCDCVHSIEYSPLPKRDD